MIRGTTPTLTFRLPFETAVIDRFYITFSQYNKEVFSLDKSDCTLGSDYITVKLNQAHTLSLASNCGIAIQIRLVTTSGDALASDMIHTDVDGILKDGEI